jgi:hypothetical protein
MSFGQAVKATFQLHEEIMNGIKAGGRFYLPRADGGEPDPFDPFVYSRVRGRNSLFSFNIGFATQHECNRVNALVEFTRTHTGITGKTRDDVLSAATASYLKLFGNWRMGRDPLLQDAETGVRTPWEMFKTINEDMSDEVAAPAPERGKNPAAGAHPAGSAPA